ncbi:MAG: segregation/condensation protein A [Patescibacteria group bacterium]|nr:segregation/condensation protein A [Patescibacteria group bacterium]
MEVVFHVEHFEGPLDLLLQLIEQDELDISKVSLANVAEQFVEHVHNNPSIPPEELADFLVVAAKLMYIKSKQLLPSLYDEELEEGMDLEAQLREYQRFVSASKEIEKMWNSGKRSYTREGAERAAMKQFKGFVTPIGITPDLLMHTMRRIISRLEPLVHLPKVNVERVVTIQQKIQDLFQRIKSHANTTFRSFVSGTKDKTERVVSFLALLELVKQRFVDVDQSELFNDIDIKFNPKAPKEEPMLS